MPAGCSASDAVANWGRIDVERLGGLAGFGMPGSPLCSRGYIMAHDLSPADQCTLYKLFEHPTETPSCVRDAFHYHLTRQSDSGPQSVIAAEASVPDAIRNCVCDELLPAQTPPHGRP